MNMHQPIETIPTLYICPLCAWRGVLTTAGLVTTEHGDRSADHLAAIVAQQQLAHDTAERIMTRLREQYASGAALPRCDGRHVFPCEEVKTGHCVCDHQDGYRLQLRQLQRLYRAVAGEFTR